MDAIECIKKRRSIRSYIDKEIPKQILSDIIDCGRMAPTAMNVQPFEFIVITDKPKMKKVADITDYGKFIPQGGACILVICKDSKYYLEDGVAALENVLLAARAYDIGTCWIAGDKKAYCDKILDTVGVPTGYKLIGIVAMGYTKELNTKINKRLLDDVLHWEKY